MSGVSAKASAIRMSIVAPNDAEQQFLADVSAKGSFKRKQGLDWSEVLRAGVNLPGKDQLREHTQEQVGFHMLLSSLRTEGDLTAARQEVENMPMPDFLAPETECLLLEIAARSGQDVDDEASRLMQQHPDLRWRLTQIKAGRRTLLRSPKTAGDDDK
jgi:hypothetical protein